MIPLTNTFLSAMKGSIGKELLSELWVAPWDTTRLRTIDELGVAHGTSTGTQRKRNEDRVAIAYVTSLNQEHFAVALVCDGVGGSEMGDVAATLAIASFIDELTRINAFLPLPDLLVELIRKMDHTVRSVLGGRGTTTASIVLASSTGRFVAANVGDSRIYSWKPNGLRLQQVSVDDTIENELLNLNIKDASALDARGLRGRLSQAIGESGRTTSDLRIVVLEKDKFEEGGMILATDGAWKSVEAGFKSLALHATSATEAMRRIITFSAWTGGIDNVSIVAIEDMLKFAKIGGDSVRQASTTSRATVWICDNKFIICNPTQATNTRSQVEAQTSQSKSETKNDKSKAKTASRRKPSTSSPRKIAIQLGFEVGSNVEFKSSNKQQKAEISTDDDELQKSS
jgi:serine/threonine protein phosphatase PrpC